MSSLTTFVPKFNTSVGRRIKITNTKKKNTCLSRKNCQNIPGQNFPIYGILQMSHLKILTFKVSYTLVSLEYKISMEDHEKRKLFKKQLHDWLLITTLC